MKLALLRVDNSLSLTEIALRTGAASCREYAISLGSAQPDLPRESTCYGYDVPEASGIERQVAYGAS